MSRLASWPRTIGRFLIAAALAFSVCLATPMAALAEDNDTLPGVTPPPSPFQDTVSVGGDLRDVFKFSVTEGQVFGANLYSWGPGQLRFALFGPGTTDVDNVAGAMDYTDLGPGDWHERTVLVPKAQAGDYYFVVTALSGTADYRFIWGTMTPSFKLLHADVSASVVKGQPPAWDYCQAHWDDVSAEMPAFTAESDRPWLSVEPTSGTAYLNGYTQFNLHMDAAALAPGSYEGTVTVRILGAEPRTCSVTLHVLDAPNMSISSPPVKVKYNTAVTFTGQLRGSSGALLPGKRVALQSSTNGSTWTTVTAQTSLTGAYAASARVPQNTYYRWWFAGDADAAACASARKRVQSYASLTAPNVPSRVRPNRWYTCVGYLKPQHLQGKVAIVVEWQYYYRGHWRKESSASLRVANFKYYSIYGYRDKYQRGLPRRWRVRVRHSDSSHLMTYSSWRYYSVY